MEIKVTAHHFFEMIKKGHSLDVIFLLKLAEEETSIKEWCESNVKIKNLYQGMLRKGLLNEGGTISLEGKELLAFLDTPEEVKLEKKIVTNDDFNTWWELFPKTDGFTHRGKTFGRTRALRVSQDKCEGYFKKIINKGEYTGAEIIAATQYDVNLKKELSVKKNSNQLTFMQNSGTYLYNNIYEGFVELIKEGSTVDEGPTKGLEIDI